MSPKKVGILLEKAFPLILSEVNNFKSSNTGDTVPVIALLLISNCVRSFRSERNEGMVPLRELLISCKVLKLVRPSNAKGKDPTNELNDKSRNVRADNLPSSGGSMFVNLLP